MSIEAPASLPEPTSSVGAASGRGEIESDQHAAPNGAWILSTAVSTNMSLLTELSSTWSFDGFIIPILDSCEWTRQCSETSSLVFSLELPQCWKGSLCSAASF